MAKFSKKKFRMFHRWCRIQTLDFLKKRKFSNLPVQHKIDGTRWDRIPYPLYARRVIYVTPVIIGGIIGATVYLDPEFPENPNAEVIKVRIKPGTLIFKNIIGYIPPWIYCRCFTIDNISNYCRSHENSY